MEERVVAKGHKVILNNRKNGQFTGVLDVVSFDPQEILLETEQGMLQIKGADLHVNRLTLEKGEVDVEGRMDCLQYTETQTFAKKGESLIGRLFG